MRVLLELMWLLIWRLRSGASGFPSAFPRVATCSPSRCGASGDEVQPRPEGWLVTDQGIRVLYGCTPDGKWLRFRHYDDDSGQMCQMSAPDALEAIRAGVWVVVGSEEEALEAGRELAMEQMEYLILELLA